MPAKPVHFYRPVEAPLTHQPLFGNPGSRADLATLVARGWSLAQIDRAVRTKALRQIRFHGKTRYLFV